MNHAPVEVHSVLFRPDEQVEITFAEKDQITPEVSVIKTIVLDRKKFEEQVEEIEVSLFELVDEGLLALRNPPAEKRA